MAWNGLKTNGDFTMYSRPSQRHFKYQRKGYKNRVEFYHDYIKEKASIVLEQPQTWYGILATQQSK